jgi:ABC-type Mn2+/Zn2+ transport system permease subunit
MTTPETLSFALALIAAAAAGLVGAFALMRRMTLAGDVMSHITLPGLGLAIVLFPHMDPIVGGAATLLIGALLIWRFEKQTALASETAIGVVFAAALAIGALVTPSEELIDALFGGSAGMTMHAFIIYAALALAVMLFILKFRHKLIISLFSPDLAQSIGLNVSRLNLFYLLSFSASIILGLRLLGALLVGALIILPAAIARQLTHSLPKFLMLSAAASVLSVGAGYLIATHYGWQQGPTVVIVASTLFLLSLLKKHE